HPPKMGNEDASTLSSLKDSRATIMLEQYLPILLFILVGLAVGGVLLAVGSVLSPNRPDPAKLSPYECGFEAFEDARMKFDVRYYLVAILFILFDLEIAFLFPWAVVLPDVGYFGFVAIMIFLAILVAGFCCEWRRGARDGEWRSERRAGAPGAKRRGGASNREWPQAADNSTQRCASVGRRPRGATRAGPAIER